MLEEITGRYEMQTLSKYVFWILESGQMGEIKISSFLPFAFIEWNKFAM
jgi:hypothetical protein